MTGDFQLADWTVRPQLNAVGRDDSTRHVSPKAMEVLVCLARQEGEVLSKEDLLSSAWPGTFVTEDALTRCIVELRRVFEDDAREPRIIQTIAKRGYRLLPPVRWLSNHGTRQGNGEETPTAPGPGTEPAAAPGAVGAPNPPATGVGSRRLSWLTPAAAAALALAAGIAIGAGLLPRFRPVSDAPVVSAITLEARHALNGTNWGTGVPTRTAIAVSRDGSFVVYGARNEATGAKRLFLRRMSSAAAAVIAGTEGGEWPSLSPDDRRLAFFADGTLKTVPVEGGVASVLVSNATQPFGASWGSDGRVTYSAGFGKGLLRVGSDGGKVEPLTTLSHGEYSHRLPHCLRGTSAVLFTVYALPMDPHPRVDVIDLASRRTRQLLEDAADARYVATGHLVLLRQGSLMAVPFDARRLQVTGQPIPVGLDVAQAMNTGISSPYETAAGQFSVSDAGSLAYVPGGIVADQRNTLVWVGLNGQESGAAVPFDAPFLAPRLSPDGQHIAYTLSGADKCVWIYDVRRSTRTGLTKEGRANFATWSPDGRQLMFGWSMSGPPQVFARPVDASAPMERLIDDGGSVGQGPGSWSRDGRWLAFWRQFPDMTQQILAFDRTTGAITPMVQGRRGDGLVSPEFSPDGKWLAYAAFESGHSTVFVREFTAGATWPVSPPGGAEPLWARDGKRLFYRLGDGVWVVDVAPGPTLPLGKPRLLFTGAARYLTVGPGRAWDISRDDRQFLMVRPERVDLQPVRQFTLIQNWTTELERLAGPRAR
jgi:DNA-binding winged helix-turn-helix (wHTH) protein/Tol biopolymer transport system component